MERMRTLRPLFSDHRRILVKNEKERQGSRLASHGMWVLTLCVLIDLQGLKGRRVADIAETDNESHCFMH